MLTSLAGGGLDPKARARSIVNLIMKGTLNIYSNRIEKTISNNLRPQSLKNNKHIPPPRERIPKISVSIPPKKIVIK
jgi:hypothetical protein